MWAFKISICFIGTVCGHATVLHSAPCPWADPHPGLRKNSEDKTLEQCNRSWNKSVNTALSLSEQGRRKAVMRWPGGTWGRASGGAGSNTGQHLVELVEDKEGRILQAFEKT